MTDRPLHLHPRQASRGVRPALALLALAAALGACRGDSITTPAAPGEPICYTLECTTPGAPEMNAPIVILPLEDAAARLVPNMNDSEVRVGTAAALTALRIELLAGRIPEARIQLARAYDHLDGATRHVSSIEDEIRVLDLADLSAIRLALVPAAAALGVSAR